ncbi:MAG: DUF488 domain-containing protein [Chloroflexota bacterium]
MAEAPFLTVGHSTRSIEAFIALLCDQGVRVLADVRGVPRSRHNPQFVEATLAPALALVEIHYVYLSGLGGFRRPRADSANGAWRNASFRGYADYMQTDAFRVALDELIALGNRGIVAVMCAEAVPWRCHRSLIADALLARGIRVDEVVGTDTVRGHRLTPFARLEGDRVLYPCP